MTEELILVNERNRAIGHGEKHVVHAAGLRHRAFSIFLVDPRGQVLLQQRQRTKYHSGGLWANSCCGHPRPGERTLSAAQRRLREELGVAVSLHFGFLVSYQAEFSNGLKENEIAHIYFGLLPAIVRPDSDEIMAVERLTISTLQREIAAHPDKYTFWLKHYLEHHERALRSGLQQVIRSQA
jgi:isopentenyl-diphosphate delta-isomerase